MEQTKMLLEVKELQKYFLIKSPLGKIEAKVKAVNGVSFNLHERETLGLVGESGCGKSTVARSLLRLTEPSGGQAFYKNENIFHLSEKKFNLIRQEIQMVFQDPYTSLNPRKRIGVILEEPLIIHRLYAKKERTERVLTLLNRVGLQLEHYYRHPHEFSGGQRQRIGLARALVMNPHIILCDEPVSALDVSIQAQIINLLQSLQEEQNLSYVFISHDLSVVRHISHRIGVMYLGRIVELGPTDTLFAQPLHPYTVLLLAAVPKTKPGSKRSRVFLEGEIPSSVNLPQGCCFHTRCPHTKDICKEEVPLEKEISKGHFVSCHLHSNAM